jgi:hypothetical protein
MNKHGIRREAVKDRVSDLKGGEGRTPEIIRKILGGVRRAGRDGH